MRNMAQPSCSKKFDFTGRGLGGEADRVVRAERWPTKGGNGHIDVNTAGSGTGGASGEPEETPEPVGAPHTGGSGRGSTLSGGTANSSA